MSLGQIFRIAIVGMGPRGLSVLERLCANIPDLTPDQEFEIHVFDPYPPGPGGVWRTNQSKHLLANTVASQVTVFTDPSVDCEGPIVPGPSLYEWAKYLLFSDYKENYSHEVLREARELLPDSYPTRVFYGHYLEWVYQWLVHTSPTNVTIHYHQTQVVSMDDLPDGRQILCLENKTEPLIIDAVVLALGHTSITLSEEESILSGFAKENGLLYVAPSNPADVTLELVNPGQPVILRGLGLNFFDYMALLSVGRGGKFVRRDGRLVYEASGREPKMFAGSRRGVPYHARGNNEKGPFGRHEPLFLSHDVINKFRKRTANGERINFRKEVWPLIAKEVETVYYTTLISSTSCYCKGTEFQNRYCNYPWGSEKEKQLLDEFGVSMSERWNWERVFRPYKDISFGSQGEYRSWLIEYLFRDHKEAQRGNVSGPLKAALDVMRDLRNEIRLIVDHGGISGISYLNDLQLWYNSLNAFLSIGPPASRIEEMIALIEAGILEVIGPDMQVETLSSRFRAYSPHIPSFTVESTAFIEARLPEVDLRRTTNPLLKYLLKTGQCCQYVITNTDGSVYETGGLSVTTPPNRLINKAGVVHPRRFAFGVPTEGVHWVTFAGIRPGVNSVTLLESDAIARAILVMATEMDNEKIPHASAL